MSITITICVTDDPNVSVQTKATDVTEGQIRPMLDRARRALQAEIDALEACPYHQRSQPDPDLVCTSCRWVGGHAPKCPRAAEPWSTLGDTADANSPIGRAARSSK